ncbi:MAG: FAD-dependent oxidoreductase, partial [Oscillospiraceae bacterium]|nr:FAD-dependent oxidoreductase [Oscillospiraceae bacterium]
MDKNDLNEIRAEDVTVITSACVEGANPPCARVCPFTLDVRAFVGRAEKGKWQTAFKSYRDAVVFPELVSRLCPAPCEGVCTRESVGGAIDLGGLERATVGFAKNKRRESYVIPQKDKKIAIVGAGAAGLSAALSLSLKKYRVTVFERAGAWGGALRGHADFAIFDAEWRESFSTLDAELRFNAEIADLDALAGFDAAYIATGDGGESFGLLAGFDSELLSTARAGAFLGGGLIGADLMTGVAQGRRASQSIETYLQTGKPSRPPSQDCDWSPDASEFAHSPRVAATDGGFTEEQAQAEAARCLKCDCDKCMQGCEMLRRFHKMPIKIANEVYTDMRANPPFAAHTLTREAYSCNNCGYCKRECPKSIDAGELLRLSRRARVAAESAPPALHDYWLREMDFSTGEAALIAA